MMMIQTYRNMQTLCGSQGARAHESARRGGALGAGCRKDRSRRPRAPHLRFLEVTFLPRKEVIQPHLPVRLPCYDFTPLTLHTFDASAPCGFGRRLRVQTTRVV